ncbi:XRE family transcriptional regulator [Nonomuraea sp. B12E4]|uniref:helix-turn-helix domain-containing protein n=1 Tax=Nonomuraea sp. B12E4 TaxID=3153564 RepID=UPI00325E9AF6
MVDSPVNVVAENLRRLRAGRRLSIVELSRRSGVARATLTALESGKGNPTLDTLYALAKVLHTPLADLIADFHPPGVTVLRAGEGPRAIGTAADARLLGRLDPHLRTDLYELVIRPGAAQHSDAHQAGVIEYFLLHTGTVRMGPEDQPVALTPGDYVRYRADVPHLYEAAGGDARGTLVIQTPFDVDPETRHIMTAEGT